MSADSDEFDLDEPDDVTDDGKAPIVASIPLADPGRRPGWASSNAESRS